MAAKETTASVHEFIFVQQRFPSLLNFHLFLCGSLFVTDPPTCRLAELPVVLILSFSIEIKSLGLKPFVRIRLFST